jgi:hypothetical protein
MRVRMHERPAPVLAAREARVWAECQGRHVRHRLNVGRSPYGVTPARDFGAYSVTFDGKALGIGETLEPAPGVTLTRRC